MVKRTFIVIGIALLVFFLTVPFISYKRFKATIKESAFNHLITTRDLLKLQIWNYFNERYGDIDVLSRNPVIAQGFTRLTGAYGTYSAESPQYQRIVNLYQPLMEYYVADYGYTNIFFIDKKGDVIFSVMKEEFSGKNLLVGEFKDLTITRLYSQGLTEVSFGDYEWREELSEFTSYFTAPVYESGKLLGVLIIEIPFYHLDAMLTQRSGLGQTGEMYLVGDDNLMRSNSRFSEEPTILKKIVDTEATREAFQGYVGAKIVKDYRGVSVLSAYTPLNLNFINWALMAEIDEEEAFESIRNVEFKLTMIAIVIMLICIGYLYFKYKKENAEYEYDDEEYEEEGEEGEESEKEVEEKTEA